MAWQGLGELCVRGGDPDARGGVVDGGDLDSGEKLSLFQIRIANCL